MTEEELQTQVAMDLYRRSVKVTLAQCERLAAAMVEQAKRRAHHFASPSASADTHPQGQDAEERLGS
jgi:hypothetical protein